MQLLHQRLSLANTLSPCNWRRSVVSKRVLTVLQIIKTVIFLFAAVSTGWAIVFLMEEERRPRSFERAVQTGPTDWTDAKKKKKQSFTRRIVEREPRNKKLDKFNKNCTTTSLWEKKLCLEKFCAPPLTDFIVHSQFKRCSRASLLQNFSCWSNSKVNDHTRETCSPDRNPTTHEMIELQSETCVKIDH